MQNLQQRVIPDKSICDIIGRSSPHCYKDKQIWHIPLASPGLWYADSPRHGAVACIRMKQRGLFWIPPVEGQCATNIPWGLNVQLQQDSEGHLRIKALQNAFEFWRCMSQNLKLKVRGSSNDRILCVTVWFYSSVLPCEGFDFNTGKEQRIKDYVNVLQSNNNWQLPVCEWCSKCVPHIHSHV